MAGGSPCPLSVIDQLDRSPPRQTARLIHGSVREQSRAKTWAPKQRRGIPTSAVAQAVTASEIIAICGRLDDGVIARILAGSRERSALGATSPLAAVSAKVGSPPFF